MMFQVAQSELAPLAHLAHLVHLEEMEVGLDQLMWDSTWQNTLTVIYGFIYIILYNTKIEWSKV